MTTTQDEGTAPAPRRARRRPHRSRIGAALLGAWQAYARLVRVLTAFVSGTALACLAVLFVNYVVLSTPNGAYRTLDPADPACAEGLRQGWTILADVGRADLGRAMPRDGGWRDASNDERAVVARDPAWGTHLRCALQRHVVPATSPGGTALDYDLGFLEFGEDGEPYALTASGSEGDRARTSGMLRDAMESDPRARGGRMAAVKPVITQLDVLKAHLETGSHYVIVFVHGWRNDARIGNGNVADLRLYAAHSARFLQQRCANEPTYCGMRVTAVYVGWRGARVDERGLKDLFGDGLGGVIGGLSAGATLFDRKPVSEAIAPAAVSALRTIEAALAPPAGAGASPGATHNRMIVVGHSLGGNMLATGLRDHIVRAVRRHRAGETLAPVLGNLVVLLNPASEATKWTAIQREIWNAASPASETPTGSAPERTGGAFPTAQRPVVVSLTAALAFPAGGLRSGDCAWIGLDVDDRFAPARQAIRRRLANTDAMFDAGIDYDWATHDLFPAFKFDFRPIAAYLDRVAARIEGHPPKGQSCAPPAPVTLLDRIATAPIRALSLLASTFPFQDSAPEDSHTIGNLDPPRPAAGLLADALPSALPFGTTHELLGLRAAGSEAYHPYASLADAAIDCPITNRWLSRARARMRAGDGASWDSESLAPPEPGVPGQGRPAAEFIHGLRLTGIAPITEANDPFWNVRAFDNALSRHDGYRLSSLICAVNQLVMDDITPDAARMRSQPSDPRGEAPRPAE